VFNIVRYCVSSHEIDGEPTDMDAEDKESSGDMSRDMTRVEGVCKEMGFVMCANQGSRWVNTVLTCC